MLKRWLSPTRQLESDSAEKRRSFLEGLKVADAASMQDALVAAYRQERDRGVAELILSHLTSLEPVADLAGSDAVLAGFAAAHPERASDAMLASPRVMRERIARADDDDARTALIQALPDISARAAMIVDVQPTAREPLLALPEMRSADGLNALEKASRDRDKRLNRYARDAIKTQQQTRDALTAAQGTLDDVAASCSQLLSAEAPDSTTRAVRRSNLLAQQQRWQAAITEWRDAAEKLAGHGEPAPAEPADPFAEIDLSPPKESPYRPVLERLQSLTATAPETIRSELVEADRQWQALLAVQAPSEEDRDAYARHSEALHNLASAHERLHSIELTPPPALSSELAAAVWPQAAEAKRWLKTQRKAVAGLAWPSGLAEPETITEQKAAITSTEQALAHLEQLAEHAASNAETSIDRGQEALEGGNTQAAVQCVRDVRATMQTLPDGLAKGLERRLGSLQKTLGELRDWQTYATSPKREALVAQMQGLIGDAREPSALADAIKAVRAEWNALGKPANREEHSLREAFDRAAEEAFEPCRAHFAQLGEARQENLAKREALADQVEQYLEQTDWQLVDLNAAEQIMRQARQEWREAFPVPRGKDKAVTQRFEALQDTLHGHLRKGWDRNIARKQALIDRAEALQDESDLAARTNGIKSLQAEWKSVGPIPRGQDQKLWRAFRSHCDAAFEARKQQGAARAAEFETRQAEAEAANVALEQALDAPPSRKTLAELRSRFDAAGDLGRAANALTKRQEALVAQYEERLAEAARKERAGALEAIANEDRRLSAADARGEDAHSERSEFSKRDTVADPTAALARLAITAEIGAGIDSPPEAASARMQLQVEMMNASGGRAQLPSVTQLLEAWCSIAGKPETPEAEALRGRFFAALAEQA